ncbi:MAG: TIGR03790 family protein [Deltaproteobacteria bacterium]|nr:TIGR03790 family protein [Deltaproteobacteria bacterium]
MTLREKHGQSGLIFILVLLAGLTSPSVSLALSARDLIIVFNRNLPESREVAAYYAGKRQAPVTNLVGVEVPASEDISRDDFDRKLAPPVRAAVDKLKAQGRTPAILLVYGIPLRVGPAAVTKAEEAFKELAPHKIDEYQKLVLEQVRRLDRYTGASPPGGHPPQKLTLPTQKVLIMAQESFLRGMTYLEKKPATPGETEARAEVMSLLIRLGGTSPEARALMAKMARSQGQERQALQRQELLGWNAVMNIDVQEEMFRGILPKTALETAASIRFTNGLIGELKFWEDARLLYAKRQTVAAVDSEITLIMAGLYQTAGWLPNPFNLRFNQLPVIARVRAKTLMVGRLDGPTPAMARRLVDDALEVEKAGLSGVFYLDARGLTGQATPGNYVWFDQHLLRLSDLLKKHSDMKVVLDKQPGLFPPGSCPDAALYCGWYSLAKYVPAFKWNKGAVGYHVASSEATTLKRPGANVWCKRMLEEGVAATLGPVAEPYLFSFPLPDQFFPLLMTGKLTLLEVYFLTVPQVSWMQLLIGDPLYQPFKNHPAVRPPKITQEKAPEQK